MPGDASARPLEGLRVLELGIAIAAPSCGRFLAHHGADVMKVESPGNPDVTRLFGSAWARGREDIRLDGAWLDTGPYVTEMSAGKRSVALDLKRPDGLAAARRILARCDILITNYSAPAVAALGMGYADARQVREDLVYVALPGFGSDPAQPYYEYLSWGPNQSPLVGIDELTGYPEDEPAGVASVAPPDYCSGLHALVAVLAGLAHRDRTGEGTFVDLSQFEATVALLGPFLLDHELSGRSQPRSGNSEPGYAPSGTYPCRGVDRWVAISVEGDDAWRSLGRVAGDPPWAGDARFADASGREAHRVELDELLSGWTVAHGADEVASWLQAEGVAAYPVLDTEGLLIDPQLRDREWYQVRPGGRFHRDLFGGVAQRLEATPGHTTTAGPVLGEHTRAALIELGGYGDDEVDGLVASGAAYLPQQPDLVLHRPYEPYLPLLVPHGEVRP